ncbi:hypothetical protein ACWDUL_33760 [Nocardia niigatensis]
MHAVLHTAAAVLWCYHATTLGILIGSLIPPARAPRDLARALTTWPQTLAIELLTSLREATHHTGHPKRSATATPRPPCHRPLKRSHPMGDNATQSEP